MSIPFQPQDQHGEGNQFGWNDLVASGYIEYVDTEEEETTMIAMNIKDLEAARNNPMVGTEQLLLLETCVQGLDESIF